MYFSVFYCFELGLPSEGAAGRENCYGILAMHREMRAGFGGGVWENEV